MPILTGEDRLRQQVANQEQRIVSLEKTVKVILDYTAGIGKLDELLNLAEPKQSGGTVTSAKDFSEELNIEALGSQKTAGIIPEGTKYWTKDGVWVELGETCYYVYSLMEGIDERPLTKTPLLTPIGIFKHKENAINFIAQHKKTFSLSDIEAIVEEIGKRHTKTTLGDIDLNLYDGNPFEDLINKLKEQNP